MTQKNSMSSLRKNLIFSLGSLMNNNSLLYLLNGIIPGRANKLHQRNYDLCLDGFQRSGNGYFYHYFSRWNNDKRISVHLHASANVIRAVNLEKPTIVLIRQPADAIASLLVWDPNLSEDLALKSYIKFYKTLIPYRHKFALGVFSELVSNPDSVIKLINEKFNLDFKLGGFSSEQLSRDLDFRKKRIKGRILDSPYPNQEKEARKEIIKDALIGNHLLKEAQALYDLYLE